jgi:hypothetical protein
MMSRRPSQHLPIDAFRKVEGPKILEALGEARRTLCHSPIPYRSREKLLASDIIERIDDLAELLTGDRTHSHIKMHS